jgi:SAM-dependent methyltransferase
LVEADPSVDNLPAMTSDRREEARAKVAPAPPIYMEARAEFAKRFLVGEGLEIGALNLPLEVGPYAHVTQVDRMTTDDLRLEYPEMADHPLLEVDIVDDGETLATIADESQDFIIANHFLEHTEDPIGTIGNHLGKLRPGGILFYAVPDGRYTFDFRRPLTPLAHMIRDHEQGSQISRSEHFDEWSLKVGGSDEDRADDSAYALFKARALEEARRLEAEDFSIHRHVWDQASFLGLILHCRERFDDGFDIEAAARRMLEFIVVLRKQGGWPEPPSLAAPATRSFAQRAAATLRRVGKHER